MQEVKCTKCNTSNAKGLNFCVNCGNRLSTSCPHCGGDVPPDSRYCPHCAALCGTGRFGKGQHKVEATDKAINCPQCGLPDNSGKRFCTACGARLGIPCPQCGIVVDLTSGFCPNCGCIVQAAKNNDK